MQVRQGRGVPGCGNEMEGAVVFLGAAPAGVGSVESGEAWGAVCELCGVTVDGFDQVLDVVGQGQGEDAVRLTVQICGSGVRQQCGMQGAPGGGQCGATPMVCGMQNTQIGAGALA